MTKSNQLNAISLRYNSWEKDYLFQNDPWYFNPENLKTVPKQ
jgi:hypothetical protein